MIPSCSSGLRLPLPDADIRLYNAVFAPAVCADLLTALHAELPWRQETIRLFGRQIPQPRLIAWHGDPDAVYTYSGLTLAPAPWTPALSRILHSVQALCGVRFNSVLANCYRDGSDSMGWHSDDEPELGPEPVIASVSFGAARTFALRHRQQRALRYQLSLAAGSLLVMQGVTQQHWQHQIPKTRRPVAARINLTFRTIVPPGPA